MPNRLAQESSPYLLQHQNNPVDWYPWGPEALARSKTEDKPIFLSIGYSACHWCHVMEHESFENATIAERMNALYVCIKVDREERPDLDQIYMNAVQLMTGRGGWPMSVFLTPDLQPFYGGTYWPPTSGRGMPGFDLVLERVAEAWRDRREAVIEQAGQLTNVLQTIGREETSAEGLRPELLQAAETKLERAFDYTHGGFGQAPKFPHSLDLQLLLRAWRRRHRPATLSMVRLTLDKMANGGIYDHLGGGFARYSVDERWLAPHFEKMLYDNALLTSAYLEAYQVRGEERFARIARETCDYILRDMLDESGGFHSTEDADSEGEEGKFYVWTPDEIREVLGGELAARFCDVYDVTPGGNFEHGKSILNLPKTIAQCANLRGWDPAETERELAESRAKLFAARNQRIRPGKDDKILVSWNALMIDAIARAGVVLGEPRFTAAAVNCTAFILQQMRQPDGVKLFHSYRHGVAKIDAFLDDYTYFINALVTLYETTFEENYIVEAIKLADFVLARFADKEAGGFYFTADDHEQLIARNKDLHDGSVPSGNGMAATALARLGKLTGRNDYLDAARGTLKTAMSVIEKQSMAAGQLLLALDFVLGPTMEIVVMGDEQETNVLLADFHRGFVPNRVLARRTTDEAAESPLAAMFAGKTCGASPRVYLCENFTCQAPVEGSDAIRGLWNKLQARSASE